jgi:hypothetical protein
MIAAKAFLTDFFFHFAEFFCDVRQSAESRSAPCQQQEIRITIVAHSWKSEKIITGAIAGNQN